MIDFGTKLSVVSRYIAPGFTIIKSPINTVFGTTVRYLCHSFSAARIYRSNHLLSLRDFQCVDMRVVNEDCPDLARTLIGVVE